MNKLKQHIELKKEIHKRIRAGKSIIDLIKKNKGV